MHREKRAARWTTRTHADMRRPPARRRFSFFFASANHELIGICVYLHSSAVD
jgi:hypothetical protein